MSFFFSGLFINPALAQIELVKLTASDAAEGDFFGGTHGLSGQAVSISSRTAIIGALFDDDGGIDSGSAYVFQDTSAAGDWSSFIETNLTASDAAEGDWFGASVSIDGRTAIIGAVGDNEAGRNSGSAYVFQDTSPAGDWSSFSETKLTASDAAKVAFFGLAVSISGRTAIIGAPSDRRPGTDNRGSAYVFQDMSPAGDWSSFIETKLTPSDLAEGHYFGVSVSISGNTAIIGARGDDDGGYYSGAAYILQDTSPSGDWSSFTETKLTASDPAELNYFGYSVSISGRTAIIGAFGGGSAYVFQDTSPGGDWTFFTETKLIASDGSLGDSFGKYVWISDDTAIAGSPGDDDAGPQSGSAYVFQDTSTAGDWSSFIETKLTASDGDRNDLFGRSVSISGDMALVGAPRKDDGGIDSGSAYLYDFRPARRMLELWQTLNHLDLLKGMEIGLRAKFDRAWIVLRDGNKNNDVVAIQILNAFVHQVEGQRGKTIAETDADALQIIVLEIIALLGGA
jgi:hypothetical protein